MNLVHRFGLLMQDAFVKVNSFISPAVVHNVEKHAAIKKALFYKHIEGIPGDYLEFGVYEGTSLKGAATYWSKISGEKIRFIGFDSFEGMPAKTDVDDHPFYHSFDFSTNFKIIKNRFSNLPQVRLVKGFFEQTLKRTPSEYGTSKAAVVLVDCDLHSSAELAFNFVAPLVNEGTIFILDDYFNYLGGKKRGVRAVFTKFQKKYGIECEELTKYGVGGIVFLVTSVKKR